MKRTIILSLCALAALSCSKEQPTTTDIKASDVKVVPATINATFDNTKLGLDGINLVWEEGDRIMGRMVSTASDTFTAMEDGGKINFTGDLTYSESGNLYLYATKSGQFGGDVSAYYYTWPQTQSGLLSDLANNTISWASTSDIEDNGNNTYSVSASFRPFFSLLKFNVAAGLGAKRIVIKSDSQLGGKLLLYTARYGTSNYKFGQYKFASFTAGTEFSEITISRNGNEINGDVYVSICPNEFDTDFFNQTSELTISFYDSDNNLMRSFKKALKSSPKNGEIMSLGNVTSLTPTPVPDDFDASLKIQSSATTGNTFVPLFKAYSSNGNVIFYYTSSTTSMDDVATPTTSSPEVPSTGIPVSTSTAYDRQYVKILATCTGCPDKYIQAVIRNWAFGSGLTTSSSEELSIPDKCTNSSNGSYKYLVTPVAAAPDYKFYITAQALIGGNVSMFFKGQAGSKELDFNLYVGSSRIMNFNCALNTVPSSSPAAVIGSADNVTAGTECKVEMDVYKHVGWSAYFGDFAILEWQEYTPVTASQAKVNVDALSNGTQYNF